MAERSLGEGAVLVKTALKPLEVFMKKVALFCLISAIILMLAAGGTVSLAANVISSVTIVNLDEPVVGETPDYSWNTAETRGFRVATSGSSCIWYESSDGVNFKQMAVNVSGSSQPRFKLGYTYRFETVLRADEEYSWNLLKMNVTINGKSAKNVSISGDMCTIRKEFGPLDVLMVEKVTILGIDGPVAGEKPSFQWETLEKDLYTVDRENVWEESTDGKTYTPMATDGSAVFTSGRYYRFVAGFELLSGFRWDTSKLAVTIDGEEQGEVKLENDKLLVTLDFGRLDIKVIDTLTITSLSEPVFDNRPDYDWGTFEKTMFTAKDAGKWYVSTDGTKFDLMPGAPGTSGTSPKFKMDNYYRFEASFKANTGCEWNLTNLEVSVNGNTVKTWEYKDSYVKVTVSYGKPSPRLIENITMLHLAEPVIGADPDYEWEVTEQEGFVVRRTGEWSESENGKEYTVLTPDQGSASRFKGDCYYKFTAAFEASKGYAWDLENLMILVGGIRTTDYEFRNDMLFVTMDFGKLVRQTVRSVDVSGVNAPQAGAVIDRSYTLTGNANCEPDNASGLGYWFESDNGGATYTEMSNGATFKEGCKYYFMVRLVAKLGYELSGQITVNINGNRADSRVSLTDSGERIAEAIFTFDRLGGGGITVKPAGGASSFHTYTPVKAFSAEVTLTGASKDAVVEWFFCNFIGENTEDTAFATGTKATIPGISSENTGIWYYVKVVVTEPGDAKAGSSAVIPYALFPEGFVEGEKVTVSLKGRDWRVITREPDERVTVEAEITGALGDVKVNWYECDQNGNPKTSSPFAQGTSATLFGITEANEGKDYFFLITAEDSRGASFTGKFVFLYKFTTKDETEEPTPTPPGPWTDATATPDRGGKTSDPGTPTPGPGETAEPSETEGNGGKGTEGMVLSPLVLGFIIGGAVVVIAACFVVGFLLGRKRRFYR